MAFQICELPASGHDVLAQLGSSPEKYTIRMQLGHQQIKSVRIATGIGQGEIGVEVGEAILPCAMVSGCQ
jgi:hypothetical protein